MHIPIGQDDREKTMKVKHLITFLVLALIFVIVPACSKTPIDEATEIIEKPVTEIEILFDIPSLLNKSAWEIKDILGEPVIFDEPTNGEFGILLWTKEIKKTKDTLMFGFDFYEDGSIADNTLVFTAIREGGPKINLDDVLKSGNLNKDSDKYIIDIRKQTNTYINIWIKY